MIKSIYTLSLSDFMICRYDEDLSVLGGNSDEERQQAWEDIYQKYLDGIIDEQQRRMLKLLLEKKDIEKKKYLAYLSVDCLRQAEGFEGVPEDLKKPFITMLSKLGISRGPYPEKPEEKEKWLSNALTRSKVWDRELTAIDHSLKSFGEKKGVEETMDERTQIMESLITLSHYFNHPVTETISVGMYISYVQRYRKEIKEAEMKKLRRT